MRSSRVIVFIALACGPLFASIAVGQDRSKPFVDPAPPTAVEPAAAEASAPPVDHAGLTFHATPKPPAPGATTHEWRSFLGPTHDAVSTESNLLAAFPKDGPAKVWEVKKGEGYAAAAVVGDRLVLFHRVGDEEIVDCLHRETGKRFWTFAYPSKYRDRYGYNNGPRCAPVSDGERVFTYGAEGKLHCLDLATGRVVWKRDLTAEFKLEQSFFGVGATPLIEKDVLIVNVGADKGPSVAGFDLKTGKMVWGAGTQWGASYASPVPADVHGKRRVFVFAGGESRPASGGLMCIDPANGAVDFSFPWRGRRIESVNASSPVVLGDTVFISECYGRGSAMVRVTPDFKAKLLWEVEDFGTHFMTAIHQDGHLYGVHGHGPLDSPIVCLDVKDGKELWRHEPEYEELVTIRGEPVKRRLNLARASLVHFPKEGRTLCLGEYGHLLWLNLNPTGYKELSRAWLFAAGETWTGPVVSNGLLYVCQNSEDGINKTAMRLICYDLRAPK